MLKCTVEFVSGFQWFQYDVYSENQSLKYHNSTFSFFSFIYIPNRQTFNNHNIKDGICHLIYGHLCVSPFKRS